MIPFNRYCVIKNFSDKQTIARKAAGAPTSEIPGDRAIMKTAPSTRCLSRDLRQPEYEI